MEQEEDNENKNKKKKRIMRKKEETNGSRAGRKRHRQIFTVDKKLGRAGKFCYRVRGALISAMEIFSLMS